MLIYDSGLRLDKELMSSPGYACFLAEEAEIIGETIKAALLSAYEDLGL